jgi:uncharacterized membrane protein YraQ (UPF0718 family)
MSYSDMPPPQPPIREPGGLPPPPPRNGCLTAFMVIVGIVLLLPGLCALIFGIGSLTSPGGFESGILPFVLVGLMVGAAGVLMIRRAIRDPRS